MEHAEWAKASSGARGSVSDPLRWCRGLAIVLLVPMVVGCSSLRGGPRLALDPIRCDTWVNEEGVHEYRANPGVCATTLASVLEDGFDDEERNLYIERTLITIDQYYAAFVQ